MQALRRGGPESKIKVRGVYTQKKEAGKQGRAVGLNNKAPEVIKFWHSIEHRADPGCMLHMAPKPDWPSVMAPTCRPGSSPSTPCYICSVLVQPMLDGLRASYVVHGARVRTYYMQCIVLEPTGNTIG